MFLIAEEFQHEVGMINIKDEYSKYGIWKSVYCINAQTHSVHTENNCRYTVVIVPKQSKYVSKSQTNFHVNLNYQEPFYLEMNQPITIMFSGKSLPHQQLCNAKIETQMICL